MHRSMNLSGFGGVGGLSRPWGLTVPRQIQMNTSFSLEPIQFVQASCGNTMLLCRAIPSATGPWVRVRSDRQKAERLHKTRLRRSRAKRRMNAALAVSGHRSPQLKRLKRGPFRLETKSKKEVAAKREQRQIRQQFKKGRHFGNIYIQLLDRFQTIPQEFPRVQLLYPGRSECKVWHCRGTGRKVRSRCPSRVSTQSTRRCRSRSPIHIRSRSPALSCISFASNSVSDMSIVSNPYFH